MDRPFARTFWNSERFAIRLERGIFIVARRYIAPPDPAALQLRPSVWGSLAVLDGVTVVLKFCSLGNQALAAFAAAALNQVAPSLGSHTGTESVLILTSALRWLVGPFHLFGLQNV